MKCKSITAILLSILFVLTLCFESPEIKADAESYQDNSQTDSTGDSLSKYLGEWYDKVSVDSGQIDYNNPKVKIVITGITKDKLLFSIGQSYATLEFAIATRQADGSYLFTFNEVKSDFHTSCSYGNDLTGKLTFDGMKLTAEIGGSKTEGIGFTGELVYIRGLYKGSKCNLVDYMIDYKTAYQKVTGDPSLNLSLVEDKYSGLVSEISVGVSMGFWPEYNRYEVEGINRGSFQEDCVAKFGKPISSQKTDKYTEVVYLVDGKYHFTVQLNENGIILTMKLTYADEVKVLGYKITKVFKIQGNKIVKYIGGFNKVKTIIIPKGITEIGENAFSINGNITFEDQIRKMKTVSLYIPKNVKLDEYAFSHIGPMKITFEKGRKKIEKKAFCGCSYYLDSRTEGLEITLPTTIKTLEESAFQTTFCQKFDLKLNEGLEVIGDYALSGAKCILPSTVKKLGNYALDNWWYDFEAKEEISGGNVVLPKGLKEIGNHCINLDWPQNKITIPASVEKIGECPISYGDNPYMGGVVVKKANRYYKSDKNGWLYTKDGKNLLYAASFHGDLVVPEGVEYVGEGSLNLDPNGESGPQKIVLPKSLKKYNMKSANNCEIVFQGDPPELIGNKYLYSNITFYVPMDKVDDYKKIFQSFGIKIKIIRQ